MTRRSFVASAALTTATAATLSRLAAGQETTPSTSAAPTLPTFPQVPEGTAAVGWLERPGVGGPAGGWFAGTTFGVPWPRGQVTDKAQTFELIGEGDQAIPVQSWPIAYWPDGSLKWTAHAVPPTGQATGETFRLRPGEATQPSTPLTAEEADGGVTVDTGAIRCKLNGSGENIIASIHRGEVEIARDGKLVGFNQNTPTPVESGEVALTPLVSDIEKITLEQAGPARAVVKVEGKHQGGDRTWLPFVLRLYFYAGSDAVRVMHTFIFDGDEHKDFIRGLGLRLSVPMRDELHDRHVRFSGQDRGVFGEAVRGLTGLRRDPGEAIRKAQVAGEKTPPVSEFASTVRDRLHLIPAWGDYTLSQLSADGYEINKRTEEGHGWIFSTGGHRASGSGYIGGPTGGLAFGIRNFWQSHPTQLDIRNAASDAAEVTMWLWSPQAKAMDLRFYHDGMGMDTYEEQLEGLEITYEDYEPEFGTPHGIARTSEMMIWACEATPSREKIADFAEAVATPPLLACAPDQLIAAEVFGRLFSKPDRSTPAKAAIEDRLDFQFNYYQDQQENQRWYGFWNYGDVMHTYDPDRHVWRYDVGGFAWDNSELSPDLWLWYAYLRSGRSDIFRFAEAMTRHTGEVDVYHLGRFENLGTRHNVQHWGCSAKQMRISTAIYRRIYYYLTADERVGDLMRDLNDVVEAAIALDPVRKVRGDVFDPKPEALSLGTGTDYSAICAAWLTEWERTGDDKWRDKLVAGLESIGELPNGYFTPVTFNMHTNRFSPYGEEGAIGVSHLSAVFGLVEVNAELIQLLDVPKFREAWLQYCILYNATREEQEAALGEDLGRRNLRDHHSRLTAYAADQLNDPELAKRAWREFEAGDGRIARRPYELERIDGPDVIKPIDEARMISTNYAAQWGVSAIQNLALVPEALEEVVNEA